MMHNEDQQSTGAAVLCSVLQTGHRLQTPLAFFLGQHRALLLMRGFKLLQRLLVLNRVQTPSVRGMAVARGAHTAAKPHLLASSLRGQQHLPLLLPGSFLCLQRRAAAPKHKHKNNK